MMRLKLGACAVACALAVLAGCTLDPHYERPAAPVAVAYPQGDAYESTSAAAAAKSASGTADSTPAIVGSAVTQTIVDGEYFRPVSIVGNQLCMK